MRISTAKLFTLSGVVVIGVACGGVLTTSAAPPNPAAKIDSKQSADDAQPEIPAVPFLTLGLLRDPAVQAELGLDAKQINGVLERDAQVGWRELGGAGILGELAKGVRRA